MVIVDLDNCISDDQWRHPLIRWDVENKFLRYHGYHMAIPGDPAANLHIVHTERPSEIAIVTSRPVAYRWLTTMWLEYHKIEYGLLVMRERGDEGLPSPEIKRKALGKIRQKHLVTRAYDDRPDVIAMYKAEGIAAEHLFIHAYDWKEWYGENSSRDSGRDGFHL